MKSKAIYIFIGLFFLIILFRIWDSQRNSVSNNNFNQVENATTSTQTRKPVNSGTKLPTSVNPTVTTEKPVPTLVTNKSLSGSSFRLTTYNGSPISPDAKFILSFTDTSFNLKICNTLSSKYFIDGTVLEADNILSTQMYCTSPANIMKIESDANILLSSGTASIYKSGSTLILSQAKYDIVLSFEGY